MPAKKRTKERTALTIGRRSSSPMPFFGLAFLILGLLVALAVGDYNPSQNPKFYSDIQDSNLIGIFGVQTAHLLLYILGLAAYAVPALAFWLAYPRSGHKQWAKNIDPKRTEQSCYV